MNQDEVLKTIGLCIVGIIVGFGLVYLVCRYLTPLNTPAIAAKKTEPSITCQAKPEILEKVFPVLPLNAKTYKYNPKVFGQKLSGMSGFVSGVRSDYPVAVYFQVIHKTDGKEDLMELIPAIIFGSSLDGQEKLQFEETGEAPKIGNDSLIVPLQANDQAISGKTFYRVIIVGPDGKDKARGEWEYLGITKDKKITR